MSLPPSKSSSLKGPLHMASIWQVKTDPVSGKKFYANTMTNEVTWSCPPELAAWQAQQAQQAQSPSPVPPSSPAPQPAAQSILQQSTPKTTPLEELGGGWLKLLDNTSGKVYYAHKQSGQTQWTPPLLPPPPVPAPSQPVLHVRTGSASFSHGSSLASPSNLPASARPHAASVASVSPYPSPAGSVSSVSSASSVEHEHDRVLDPVSGKFYYVHKKTRSVQWEVPPSYRELASHSPSQAPRSLKPPPPAPLPPSSPQSPHHHPHHLQVAPLNVASPRNAGPPLSRGSTIMTPGSGPHTEPHRNSAASPTPAFTFNPNESKYPALPAPLREDIQRFSIQGFAVEHFQVVRKRQGLSKKLIPVDQMLQWQKEPLSQALLIKNKKNNGDAIQIFKYIQCFMGDQPTNKSLSTIAKSLFTTTKPALRDELFCQLCKQTKSNPDSTSLSRGWQLMALACAAFAPSREFQGYLHNYLIQNYQGPPPATVFAPYSLFLSERTIHYAPSAITFDDVEHVLHNGVRPCSVMFHGSLDYICSLQKSQGNPHAIPEILPILADAIERNGGFSTKGIFRLAADRADIENLKEELEKGNYEIKTSDPNVPADVMKHWFRDLLHPVIPIAHYDDALKISDQPAQCAKWVEEVLPPSHYQTLDWLLRWLTKLATHQAVTAMNEENIAIVFCTDLLKSNEKDPMVMLKNSTKEKNFVRSLLLAWKDKV